MLIFHHSATHILVYKRFLLQLSHLVLRRHNTRTQSPAHDLDHSEIVATQDSVAKSARN